MNATSGIYSPQTVYFHYGCALRCVALRGDREQPRNATRSRNGKRPLASLLSLVAKGLNQQKLTNFTLSKD